MENLVINLKRQPEKFDHFLKLNSGSGIGFRRVDACDGAEVSEDEVIKMKVMAPNTKLTKGAIGCAVSHFRIWQQVVEKKEPVIVFEDDAVIRDDFTAVLSKLLPGLPGWDYIALGYNTDSILDVEIARGLNTSLVFSPQYPTPEAQKNFVKSNSPVSAFRLNACFGTCGYAISPAGAKKLLKFCFPMDNRKITVEALKRTFPAFGIDCMMIDVYKSIEAFACFSPLVLPKNERNISTTVRS